MIHDFYCLVPQKYPLIENEELEERNLVILLGMHPKVHPFLNMKGIFKMNSQKWHELMLKHIGRAVLATDIKGKIIYLNESACKLLGVSEGDAMGLWLKDILKFQDEKDGHEVLLPVEQVIKQNKLYNVDRSLLMVDGVGKIRQVTYTISPLRNEEKDTVGAMVVLCEQHFNLNDLNDSQKKNDMVIPDFFFIKNEGSFVRVLAEEVMYIEAMENYALMVTESDRYTLHTTLKSLELKLSPMGFARVHRSYVVPLKKIDLIEDNRLKIGDNAIPIGKSFRSALMGQLYFV